MTGLYIFCGISVLILFLVIKSVIWDTPHLEIEQLKAKIEQLNIDLQKLKAIHAQKCEENDHIKIDLNNLRAIHLRDNEELDHLREDLLKVQRFHSEEIFKLQLRLQDNSSLHIQEQEFADIVISSAWRELSELWNDEYAYLPGTYFSSISKNINVKSQLKLRFCEAIDEQYKYRYLVYLYPELSDIFDGANVKKILLEQLPDVSLRTENLFEIVNLLRKKSKVAEELIYLKNRLAFLEASSSNLTAIPYMAAIMADYETYGIERLAEELNWGYAIKRVDKVKSIREIRKDARAIVEKNKEAQYQLAYLLNLFPNLEDVIDTEFSQLPVISVEELSEYDSAKDYLSKEEYAALSEVDRNQLALDRYKNSHNRTKWQLGRDYELYIGYTYVQKGYEVDYFGSYMGVEDLGRDLIAKKGDEVLIIQCKYWSAKKQIHENHINQLYGTMISYCIENKISKENVKAILITNIELSPTAKKMATYLGVAFVENQSSGDYPCIKCNIGHGTYGETTKIYHLPFDQQYDSTKIKDKGEFYALTVAEAEAAGFRRAFKWYGSN